MDNEGEYNMDAEQQVFEWLTKESGYVKAVIDEYRETHNKVEREEELVEYVYSQLKETYSDLDEHPNVVKNAIRSFIFFNP